MQPTLRILPVVTPDGAAALRCAMAVTPLYIGTYTDGNSQGIYRVEFDAHAGTLSRPTLVAPIVNPTFLAWHPAHPVIYAVSETNTFGPDGTGAVAALAIADDGRLQPIGVVSSGGAGPCYVSVTSSGAHALVANYAGGSVAVVPVRPDGGLCAPSCVVRHLGSGPHPVRQPGPRAHAIAVSPSGRFVVAADLGADRLFVYRLEAETGTLVCTVPGSVATSPGAGPRHFTWNTSGDTFYVVNELDSTVGVFGWDEPRGALAWRSTTSTLPAGWSGENTAAHVAIHPSDRALYVSNRGHDSIARCVLDADGSVESVETYPCGGRTPRHFALDRDGRHLIVANQESDALVMVALDGPTGRPVQTGARLDVPSPAFVLMPPP